MSRSEQLSLGEHDGDDTDNHHLKFYEMLQDYCSDVLKMGITIKSSEEYYEYERTLNSFKTKLKQLKIDWNVPESGVKMIVGFQGIKEFLGKPFSILIQYYKALNNDKAYAESKGIEDIIYVVLNYLLFDKDEQFIITGLIEDKVDISDLAWLNQLIDSYNLLLKEREEPYPVKWVKSLDVMYSRRPICPTPTFLTEKDHILLEHLTLMKSRSPKRLLKAKGDPNIAHAGISLILKDPNVLKSSPDYIRRMYLPLGHDEEARSPEMTDDDAKKVSQRIAYAKILDEKITAPRFVSSNHQIKPSIIEDKNEVKNRDQEFHHTEQEVYNFLEDPEKLKSLFEDFAKDARKLYPSHDDSMSDDIKPLTLIGFLLHIDSQKYMCQNCQVGGIGFQHPENFRKNLKNTVRTDRIKKFFSLTDLNLSHLVCLILVSTHQEFPDKGKKYKVDSENHSKNMIDIKLLRRLQKLSPSENNFFIFSKDTRIGFQQSHSPFYSRHAVALKYNQQYEDSEDDEDFEMNEGDHQSSAPEPELSVSGGSGSGSVSQSLPHVSHTQVTSQVRFLRSSLKRKVGDINTEVSQPPRTDPSRSSGSIAP